MIEPQAPPPVTGRGSPLSAIITAVVFVALGLYLFWLPLRPTAWGGPRSAGPFEEGTLPRAGWFARDARLYLADIAVARSSDSPLEATAEALAGYYAVLALARFSILWFILRRVGGSGLLATLGVAAAAIPIAFGAPRQNESEVGLLLFVILLAATTPTPGPRWLAFVALPVLFTVWANAHSSVVLGLAWLGVITIGRFMEWWNAWRRGQSPRAEWVRLLIAMALCVAAACLNPDGPRLFLDAIRMTKNPNMATLPDWQPVDFSKPAGMPWGYFATIAALLVAQLASSRVFSATALLVILTFGFWPLLQQRGLAYWWLIVPWLVLPIVAPPSLRASGSAGRWKWVVVAVGIVVLISPAGRWLITGNPRSLEDIVTADTPWRVAQALTAVGDDAGKHLPELRDTVQQTYPSGKYRGAILSGPAQGDFLAWVLDGDNSRALMLYTRPEALDPPHWGEAHQALEGRGDWWEILGRHQVNLVVIDPERWRKLADRLRESQAWRTFQDGTLLIAVRREPKLPVELMDS
jgi:hypothetical protein